jgi:hypothetical protein
MSGGDVPVMWAEYLENGDESIPETIKNYNISDVKQLKYVCDRCIPLLPKDDKPAGFKGLKEL